MNPKLTPEHTLTGRITNRGGEPLAGLAVHAFDQDPLTSDDPLGRALTEADGRYTIRYTQRQFAPQGHEIGGPDVYIRVFDGERMLGESPVHHNAAQEVTIDLRVDHAVELVPDGTLAGRIVTEQGLPAERLRVRLYRHGFGGAASLVGETVTRPGGRYVLPMGAQRGVARLEVRAVTPEGQEVPLSKPMFVAPDAQGPRVNLVAPAFVQPHGSEFDRLSEAVRLHLGEGGKLAAAREDDERQDLALLHHATGWDARLLAMAALGERLAADPDVGLDAEALYGLLRMGLPSDKEKLAQVDPQVAAAALDKAQWEGIVDLSGEAVEGFRAGFGAFAARMRLDAPLPGSGASARQFLAAAGVTEGETQAKVMAAAAASAGDPARLWREAEAQGVPKATVAALRLQGKLAFLSAGSLPVTTHLMGLGLKAPADLVAANLHEAGAWEMQLRQAAGVGEGEGAGPEDEAKLAAIVPAAFRGASAQETVRAYAEAMARKVRISFPTHVVAQVIDTGGVRLPAAQATAQLLRTAAEAGFRLGQTPVHAFFASREGALRETLQRDGVAPADFDAAKGQMKVLQRVYQTTPNNAAMAVLLEAGFTSAHKITSFTRAAFAKVYADAYFRIHGTVCSQTETDVIYDKATNITSVTYNLYTIARTVDSNPTMHGVSGTQDQHAAAKAGLKQALKDYPTLESLFGSMDYCECEHCRSVLSPAAYLVDLLQFLDIEPGVWDTFLARWQDEHGEPYPHGAAATPYAVLAQRRPDLIHIPLTCENTLTALPYIDLVNEILEHYVANGALDATAAHDTGDAPSAELLAEPQNLIPAAYDRLLEAQYPLNQPFDLWVETARAFCDHAEVPLANLLETFRPSDSLDGTPHGRRAAFLEALRISPAEAALLAGADAAEGRWHALYGFPRAPISGAANAGNATVDVPDAQAKGFAIGDRCQAHAPGAAQPNAPERTISAIGAPGSGAAPGTTRITFSGAWAAPAPANGDALVMAGVAATLTSAKTLSRRLGVTYKEIYDIVQTGFVNPRPRDTDVLFRLGLTVPSVRYHEARLQTTFYADHKKYLGTKRAAWEGDPAKAADLARFDALAQDMDAAAGKTGWDVLRELDGLEQKLTRANQRYAAFGFDAKEWLVAALASPANQRFGKVLLLADDTAGCDFDQTKLQYADGTSATESDLVRINLFVRLWRKLGWSIAETDRALRTFTPTGATPREALETALVHLSHLKALEQRLKLGKDARTALLSLWADLDTSGLRSPYAQVFLSRAVLQADPAFDSPDGTYLAAAGLDRLATTRTFSVQKPGVPPAEQVDPAHLASARVTVRYDLAQRVQHLSCSGVLSDADKAALVAALPAGASPHAAPLLDAVQAKAREYGLVKWHLPALQGALGLTATEVTEILAAAGQSIERAGLTLANVSLLHRHAVLAKGLKLTVPHLLALRQLSEHDPFQPLPAGPLADLGSDRPFATLRFTEATEQVLESGLSIDDLESLLRHRFDPDGKRREDRTASLASLRALAAGIRAIRTDHRVPDDPGAMTNETLRAKLGLVLAADVAERFLALLDGTSQTTAAVRAVRDADPAVDQVLPAAAFTGDFTGDFPVKPAGHNAARNEQSMTLRGLLSNAQKATLLATYNPKLGAGQQATLASLLNTLQIKAEAEAQAFFDLHLKRQAASVLPRGFLEAADFALLFKPSPAPSDQQEQEGRGLRRARVVNAFLPYLQDRLVRQFLVETLTAQTTADAALVESLLTDARLLALRDAAGMPRSLAEVASAAGDRACLTYFFSEDGTGLALTAQVPPDGATGKPGIVSNPVVLLGNGSAGFVGRIEAPADGDYALAVTLAKKDDRAVAYLDEDPAPVLDGTAAADNQVANGGPLALKRAAPRRLTLVVTGPGAAQAQVRMGPAGAAAACGSVRLAAYVEVAAAGAHRFTATLEKAGASVDLRLDAPAGAVRWSLATAAANTTLGEGPADAVELPVGTLHRLTVDLKDLQGGEARLLVRGEALPSGSLAQLTLYPSPALDRTGDVVLLHAKAIHLLRDLGLAEPEARFILTHGLPREFEGLDLSQLPKRDALGQLLATALQDVTANGTAWDTARNAARAADPDLAAEADRVGPLFKQFLRLAAYARLKRGMAGGTPRLIEVFDANAQAFLAAQAAGTDPDLGGACRILAEITRRDATTVHAAAATLWGKPSLGNEADLGRLWEALQAAERFGLPPPTVAAWTRLAVAGTPASERSGIARDLKDALRARYAPETWQRVARPIFDRLRQRQRDALASYVMHQCRLDRLEQLYEYFLIDPGMEPVVQTSRIRMAISSVQLFVQRCLLNLEPKVAPPALINADQWEWMKRYRVWEANRKIFLFPESWLEPEFRDDKTVLFTELEGALLQGDVSEDLAEDAFLAYLRKLDEVARLDIVGMHLEAKPNPADNTLHVIGRTYTQPHKYHYRRYSYSRWTAWEPIGIDLQGNHIAPVVWHGRLYVFWVTFIERQAQAPPAPSTGSAKLTDLELGGVVTALGNVVSKKAVEAHLHWSECSQGEWKPASTGGAAAAIVRDVAASCKPDATFIRVGKKHRPDGSEAGVYVQLEGDITAAFYLAGRNSPLEQEDGLAVRETSNPWCPVEVVANRFTSEDPFFVSYRKTLAADDLDDGDWDYKPETILRNRFPYTILPCDNDIVVGTPGPEVAHDEAAVRKFMQVGLDEIASLMQPVFYQDNEHTFYVQPDVKVEAIEDYEAHVVTTTTTETTWVGETGLQAISLVAVAAQAGRVSPPEGDPWEAIADAALHKPEPRPDWLTRDEVAYRFGERMVDATGTVQLAAGAGLTRKDQAAARQGILLVGSAGLTGARAGSLASKTQEISGNKAIATMARRG